jgi:hypothetical protein
VTLLLLVPITIFAASVEVAGGDAQVGDMRVLELRHVMQTTHQDMLEGKKHLEELEKVKEVADSDLSIKCNCYAYIRHAYYRDLPNTATIRANLTNEVGGVAVFYYPRSGVHHYAKVTEITEDSIKLDEANFSSCKLGVRTIKKTDPFLLGFYHHS